MSCDNLIVPILHYAPGFPGSRVTRRAPTSGGFFDRPIKVHVHYEGKEGKGNLDVTMRRSGKTGPWHIYSVFPAPSDRQPLDLFRAGMVSRRRNGGCCPHVHVYPDPAQSQARVIRCGLIRCPIRSTTSHAPSLRSRGDAAEAPADDPPGRRARRADPVPQEIFNGPYFCPSQDRRWYDAAEAVPGPTVERLQPIAKKYGMALVVPVYERVQAGVYYNTAAVLDHDGSYLGSKYRKTHIPHTSGFWEKYFFKPGNTGYPVFKLSSGVVIGVYICYDRHFPRVRALWACAGRRSSLTPSATVAGLSQYLWKLEQPARGGQRLLHGLHQPRRDRGAVEHRQVLRVELLRRSARQLLAMGSEDNDELIVADLDLSLIEEVRRVWQFYRDRRPDAYGDLTAELP